MCICICSYHPCYCSDGLFFFHREYFGQTYLHMAFVGYSEEVLSLAIQQATTKVGSDREKVVRKLIICNSAILYFMCMDWLVQSWKNFLLIYHFIDSWTVLSPIFFSAPLESQCYVFQAPNWHMTRRTYRIYTSRNSATTVCSTLWHTWSPIVIQTFI